MVKRSIKNRIDNLFPERPVPNNYFLMFVLNSMILIQNIRTMKKIVVFMMAVFLVCTVGSYSRETTPNVSFSNLSQSGGKKNVRARVLQKKHRSKKKIKKPKSFPKRKAKLEGHKIIQ